MTIEQIKNNHTKTIELLDAQQATIEHLQEKVNTLTSMLETYQKAYGSVEGASLTLAAKMMIEQPEDDFYPEENCPL